MGAAKILWTLKGAVNQKRLKNTGHYTVKLDYNEQLETDQICSLFLRFVITKLFHQRNFIKNKMEETVITEFDCFYI